MSPSQGRRGDHRGREVRVVAVLGMHRSGTSWLTGALQNLGLELGEVSTSAPHNKRGNRENRALRQLHESVLRGSGGSWRRPNWPNRWSRKQRTQLARHIAAMSEAHELWGFKDPRALLVLDEWHRQVADLERVGIYRHPVAVYRSLQARHPDFTEEEAFDLWTLYNRRLLAEHSDDPFPIVRFDVEADVLRAQLATVAALLRLPHAERSDEFFDATLVHNAPSAPVPGETRDVWDQLESTRLEVGV